MKADFSWKQSAKLYIGLYKELAGEQYAIKINMYGQSLL